MKRLVTAIAILSLATTAAQGKYVKKRIPLTSPPGQVVACEVGDNFYVANGDRVSAFRQGNESFVGDIFIPHTYALAFDSKVRILYASAVQDGVTQVWKIKHFGTVAKVQITSTPGDGITALAVDPLAHGEKGTTVRVYVANASDQRVDILSDLALLKSIAMPAKPTGIAMGAHARQAFVSLANGEVVSISLDTLEIVSTIQAGNSLGGIVVDPYGSQRVYALDTDAVEGLNPQATTVHQSLAVPRDTVAGAAFATTIYGGYRDGNNRYSYEGNHQIFITGPNGTSVLDGISYKVIHTFTDSAGTSVAIPATYYNKIYVPSATSNELIVIGGGD